MYRTFDEEVFLAPESIISGVLAAFAFDNDLELPDVELLAQPRHTAAAAVGGRAEDADDETKPNPYADPAAPEAGCGDGAAVKPDAWSRQAFASNGFGG
jgi:hypothetical protein